MDDEDPNDNCNNENDDNITPDPKPKWRSMFHIFLNHKKRPVLGDSGCTGSCMSYDYFVNNPYLKKFFTPRKTCGTAINGSDVPAIGDVFLKFNLQNTPMSITCKVVKGLMDPVILGWDWMSKYEVSLDAGKGKVFFCNGKSAPLLSYDMKIQEPLYRVYEDLILPPSSKVHAHVELVINGDPEIKQTKTVVTEPFESNGEKY